MAGPRVTGRPGGPATARPAPWLSFLAASAFVLFLLSPAVMANDHLTRTFASVSVVLLLLSSFAVFRARTQGWSLGVTLSLRPQHYLQALAHTAIFVYWGMYWDPLKHAAVLIAAQIVFAYALDIFLAHSRGRTYALGFGPFPIIYSTNLFLRFHDDWFWLQFLMVAVGMLAKEFIRWNRDGKRVHIFNPSSFPLAVFSLGLILTHSSNITWAEDIASLLILPPQIYLFIFAVSLPGQFVFRVTSMTLPAAVTVYAFSMFYLKQQGVYFFWDSNIPIAVFLGMHLLFTDPSTSPRSELGRVIFGVLYGASVVGLYWGLGKLGAPTYYDKLLQVPIMNLLVPTIERIAQSRPLSWLNMERVGVGLSPRQRSAVWVATWILVFGGMSFARGVGDFHEGHTVPFWAKACDAGKPGACEKEGALLNGHCKDGSGWACNELALMLFSGKLRAAVDGVELLEKACGFGQRVACENKATLSAQTPGGEAPRLKRGDPDLLDFPRILRQGKGPIPEKTPLQIYSRACDEGWMSGCDGLSGIYFRGSADIASDKARAAALATRACAGGIARACSNLGLMYKNGDGVVKDEALALNYLKQSCSLGFADACRWLASEQGK